MNYSTTNLRNIGIIGHSGSGKTSLVEAILYSTNTVDRLGNIEEGNTVSDYDTEEKKRKISISTTIQPCKWKDTKINLIDMPGYFDFVGEKIQGLKAADIAFIVLSATGSIHVGTEKSWSYTTKEKIPKVFYINKLDKENMDFEGTLNKLKERYGVSVVPVQYPIGKEQNFKGVINVISNKAIVFNEKTHKVETKEVPNELLDKVKECKNIVVEAVAETDEKLLEKYFSEGTLSEKDIYEGLMAGTAKGEIVPVMCGSAIKGIGIETILEDIVQWFPSPVETKKIEASDGINRNNIEISCNEKEPFSALVFKTIIDPFIGRLSLFKVMSGVLSEESSIYNSTKDKKEKVGKLYFLRGKQQIQTDRVISGDIGAASKLQYTSTGDTLCDLKRKIILKKIDFPKANMTMAALPKSKNDEDKMFYALDKLVEEDPTIYISRDLENAETLISGMGDIHLEVIANRVKNKFGTEIVLDLPKIPYRETIKSISKVQGKHKKQSGGHGQYGDVFIKFEPNKNGEFEFVNNIVGGVVPKQYIPAVEEGILECMKKGVLAQYPVIGIKATIYDGSYHSVDSSEMAFKIAASIAFKKGIKEAKPTLLEPIMRLEVISSEEYMGDIIGDINRKRGKILGMEQESNNLEKIIAEVPQAEIISYATDLRSITQGMGEFSLSFERYDEILDPIEVEKVLSSK
ncbi:MULTISPECIES: elongation factor G [Clostridium]|uniref:Elongation factor G n=2 Tax=Clostridium TaxID=1485 RepID=A0AAU8Z1B1_CLOBO|nr:elongation factor G [Clostridium sporogenes]AJD31139.1 translation elongation factor G [Clostridium botulinum Prevot_594]AVP62535.1 elongation factor G [Clostridium botulinum]AVP66262.1 elongation factor G [Clostridium botulinum]KRU39082.1 elongation factor G [Clostridium sporogenes]MBY7013320.1 elongation factor G [Clostridium sporogenes]